MKHIRYARAAVKTLQRIPANDAKRIRAKIHQYARNSESLARNVSKLQGRDGYRLRVGYWRVIFEEDGTVLDIIDVGPRGRIYD